MPEKPTPPPNENGLSPGFLHGEQNRQKAIDYLREKIKDPVQLAKAMKILLEKEEEKDLSK